MTLEELQRIKQWHVDHKADHPLEYHLWDAVLTFWLRVGWVGFPPTCLTSGGRTPVLCGHAVPQPLCHLAR